jgi:hypothetical protein
MSDDDVRAFGFAYTVDTGDPLDNQFNLLMVFMNLSDFRARSSRQRDRPAGTAAWQVYSASVGQSHALNFRVG